MVLLSSSTEKQNGKKNACLFSLRLPQALSHRSMGPYRLLI